MTQRTKNSAAARKTRGVSPSARSATAPSEKYRALASVV
jgi:hypothetical protein